MGTTTLQQSFSHSGPPAVKLVIMDPVTRAIEFEGVLSNVPGKDRFSPSIPIAADRKLRLEFSVQWAMNTVSRIAALVRGFLEARITEGQSSFIVTKIIHAETDDDCELMCLDSGKTSSGPCLDCSDGINTIRVCC